MCKKRKYMLLLALVFVFMQSETIMIHAAENMPKIEAESALLGDLEYGQALYAKESDKKLPVSTLCKLMTACIALENINPGQKIAASKEAVNIEGAFLGLEAGEKYDVADLLTAVILAPANDAAMALAEFVAGDEEKFVALMNSKAKELNMKDTQFKNSTGLYVGDQYTTARDIFVFLKYALKNGEFSRLFSIKGIGFNDQMLINSNKLFWQYEGIEGGKADASDIDKQVVLTYASKENRNLISIVLSSPGESAWEDSVKLLDYGFDSFMRGKIVKEGEKLKTIKVYDQEINLISSSDFYYTFPIGDNYIKSVAFFLPEEVNPPLYRDKAVGRVKYTLSDGTNIDIELFPDKEILPPKNLLNNLKKNLQQSPGLLNLILLLLFIEVLLIFRKIYTMVKGKS